MSPIWRGWNRGYRSYCALYPFPHRLLIVAIRAYPFYVGMVTSSQFHKGIASFVQFCESSPFVPATDRVILTVGVCLICGCQTFPVTV